jgi:hypothetical protein
MERALPHGARLFVNTRIQATANVDLRNLSKLEAVMWKQPVAPLKDVKCVTEKVPL